ncbi:PLP-dependent cysteine synthase family protein [Jeotgalibaca sp. A122]|uniref:PLP-dependent cysteine synthase family protein n=1 Tax=Jeotgalibaca sp. A122 TaxID=3457322 RepID=UPI003FD354DE
MAVIIKSLTSQIGETPLIQLKSVVPQGAATIYLKLESQNPAGSSKDRVMLNLLEIAEEAGAIGPDSTIVDAVDQHAAISLAMLATTKGYRSILVTPEGLSPAIEAIVMKYGSELLYTPATEGMSGAIKKAEEIAKNENYYYLAQFTNQGNPSMHEATTGPEIIDALGAKSVDAFVASVGTGGTLTGVGRALRTENPNVEIFAVEPEESQSLSGGVEGEHTLVGMGYGFIPPLLELTLYNGVIRIKADEAHEIVERLAREEGLLVSDATGAAVAGAIEIAKRLGRGKTVVAI